LDDVLTSTQKVISKGAISGILLVYALIIYAGLYVYRLGFASTFEWLILSTIPIFIIIFIWHKHKIAIYSKQIEKLRLEHSIEQLKKSNRKCTGLREQKKKPNR